MTEIYFAKVKDHVGWEFVTYAHRTYFSDNGDEISQNCIEKMYPVETVCQAAKEVLDKCNIEDSMKEATKGLIDYTQEYFTC